MTEQICGNCIHLRPNWGRSHVPDELELLDWSCANRSGAYADYEDSCTNYEDSCTDWEDKTHQLKGKRT